MKRQEPLHMRWMIRRDMPEVLQIEFDSFEFPWSEETFIDYLRGRNVIGWVAERHDEVRAFMVYELNRHSLDLLNIAVAPGLTRRGIGTQFIDHLKSKLRPERRRRIETIVRESNLDAQLFFKSHGFHATGVLKSYYDESNEDAYVMRFDVTADIERGTRLARS